MFNIQRLARHVAKACALPAAALIVVAGFLPTQTAALEKTELGCLALNIYHEARGESRQGQIAVAAVTLNRVRATQFPDSVCAVVWQNRQFSWTHTKRSYFPTDMKSWNTALKIAESSLAKDVVAEYDNLLFYHSKQVRPYWSKQKRFVARVGSHLFYSS